MSADGDHDVVALVEAARLGDQDAWAVMVDRFAGLVWSVARGHRLSHADATDVSQTVWLRLAEHLDRLHEPAALAGWLATVTRNESLRVARHAARAVPTEDVPERVDDTGPAFPADSALGDHTVAAVWAAFEDLNDRCRLLIGMLLADPSPTYAEVSATLDMPIGSIGPTRARCLRQLRASLAEARITGADRDSW